MNQITLSLIQDRFEPVAGSEDSSQIAYLVTGQESREILRAIESELDGRWFKRSARRDHLYALERGMNELDLHIKSQHVVIAELLQDIQRAEPESEERAALVEKARTLLAQSEELNEGLVRLVDVVRRVG